MMKRLALHFVPCILLCTTSSFAAKRLNPTDYDVNVHVSASRTSWLCSQRGATPYCRPMLVLSAAIDGVKSELQGTIEPSFDPDKFSTEDGFPALGDYKAKLLPGKSKDQKASYFTIKSYELLLSDGRLAKFQVTGQSE